MSSSNSPCAACKCLRRKCTQECVFAPYFPPENPQKFSNVHKVFGASNVAKLLNEIEPTQREDTVNSLAYEAESRLRDPVYGCVGLISVLQHKLKAVHVDLDNAKKELSVYMQQGYGTNAMVHPQAQQGFMPQGYLQPLAPYNFQPMHPHYQQQLIIAEPNQQQQLFETQQFAVGEQEMLRNFEQQQQHNDLMRYNNNAGFDPSEFEQLQVTSNDVQPSLALFEGGGGGGGQQHYQNIHQPDQNEQQHINQVQQHDLMPQHEHIHQVQQHDLMPQHEHIHEVQQHELMQQQAQQQQMLAAQQYDQQLHRDKNESEDGSGRSIRPNQHA